MISGEFHTFFILSKEHTNLYTTITVQSDGDFQLKGWRSRTIPLHNKLKEILTPYKKTKGYVFVPDKKEYKGHYRFDFKKSFNSVCEKAKLDWVTPHILRHTFASQLAIAGVSLYKISQWLGHQDYSTTQVYAHLQSQDEDINKI